MRTPKGTPVVERFWPKVSKTEGCWQWTAVKNGDGYGKLKIDGEHVLAHRLSWELQSGPIPEGFHVLHRCDNPGCVNPEHLFLGTHQDNMADMLAKGRCRLRNVHRSAA